jgi:hypothetical protein
VVYSQIIRQMKFIQLRDLDAKLLLETRDYELIRLVLTKFSTKMQTDGLFDVSTLICHSYRKYNPAFFEEVLLDYKDKIDGRVA